MTTVTIIKCFRAWLLYIRFTLISPHGEEFVTCPRKFFRRYASHPSCQDQQISTPLLYRRFSSIFTDRSSLRKEHLILSVRVSVCSSFFKPPGPTEQFRAPVHHILQNKWLLLHNIAKRSQSQTRAKPRENQVILLAMMTGWHVFIRESLRFYSVSNTHLSCED